MAREAALVVLRALNRGGAHYCPICERTFARFLFRDPNYMCVGCRSFARQRLMVLYLRRRTDLLTRPARVLHVAPEPAVHRILSRAPLAEYATTDLTPGPLVDVAADARQLPFEDRSFNAVICSHVLEHIPEDVTAAREFARVLRPDGVALIQVPVEPHLDATYETDARTPLERAFEYGQHDHVRVYGFDVVDRLRTAFRSVERIDYARSFSAAERWRMGLEEPAPRRGEDIYVCRPDG